MIIENTIIQPNDLILVTGANGFIGTRVMQNLLNRGYKNLRCFTRPASVLGQLEAVICQYRENARVEVISGNLLCREDCNIAVKDVRVIYHLAAGTNDKSYANAFRNSVVTTRNLLEASVQHGCLRRFVSISSFAVYTNRLHSQ